MTNTHARTWLIITTILLLAGGAFGIVLAMSSFFLFDAPGSDKNPATILLFISALTSPVMCGLALVSSWIAYGLKFFRTAVCLAFAPVLNIIGGGVALLWLEMANGGRLN